MRTIEEQQKDVIYQSELYWSKLNVFQVLWGAMVLFWNSIPEAFRIEGWKAILFIPELFFYCLSSRIKYWKLVRRIYGHRVKIFKFYKGWGLRFLYEPFGYNDFDYPEVHINLIWGKIYITLPFQLAKRGDWSLSEPQYGFYYFWEEHCFVICYGKKSKHIHMPWTFDWYRSAYLMKDGSWYNEFNGDHKRGLKHETWREEFTAKKWSQTHPYTYIRNNGDVQERLATITIYERESRRRIWMWATWFNKVSRSIDISFNEGIGEGVKSWKGGTTGCSYEILPDETPEQCLRRMEKERRFER